MPRTSRSTRRSPAAKQTELPEPSKITLTPTEEGTLNVFNAAAFDLLRVSQPGKILPCWLCMSDTAKDEAREGLRALLEEKGLIVPTVEDAEAYVRITMRGGDEIVRRWQEAELERKRGRAENNPLAFFIG